MPEPLRKLHWILEFSMQVYKKKKIAPLKKGKGEGEDFR